MTINSPLKTIEKEGNVWLCLGDQILIYIEKEGNLHVSGDIYAYSKIPPLPSSQECCKQETEDNNK